MSTDAFAAAVGKGTALKNPRWSDALRTGLIFGVIEALTPIVGWWLGQAAARYVSQWDHWIASCCSLESAQRFWLSTSTQRDAPMISSRAHSPALPDAVPPASAAMVNAVTDAKSGHWS